MRRSSQSYMADSRFPTMDGSTSTTSIDYNDDGLTGTIPSQFGLMTEVTKWDLGLNEFTGQLPSQIGLMTKLSTGGDLGGDRFLRANELISTVPTGMCDVA